MGKTKDLTGRTFHRLTVVDRMPVVKKGIVALWACVCECGNIVYARGADLTRGHTKSCGCIRKKADAVSKSRLYAVWANMIQRCSNANKPDYKYYGGRGIKVCEEWKRFDIFKAWAEGNGYLETLTLDRIDTNGNYKPSNCRWATVYEQRCNMRSNRKYRIAGKVFTLSQLCRIYGASISTVRSRLARGIEIKQALTMNRRYQLNNKLLQLSDELRELRSKKSELEYETKKVNGKIENITTEMIDLMTTDELTSFNRNGTTFSLVTQEYPAPEPERKPELWEAMKEQGYEHLFSINSQTLQATVKELISENDGVLPEWLDGLVKVAEKNSIRLTKSKK